MNSKNNYGWYAIIVLTIFFSYYFALGSYPLLDNNEGLYSAIAKEMLLSKNFIIPHLNAVPYIEKPPLLYWLLSVSFWLFGFNAFAARIITVTSAALVSFALIYFAKKLKKDRAGIVVALIFSSSVGVALIARMVFFDMLFTFLITATLLSWFCWHELRKIKFLRIGYLFFALAILTKGLVAMVLVGGAFGAFLIVEKDYRKLYQILDPIGVGIFLIIVLPWHIAAIVQHQGFAWYYFVSEHFLRFLNQRVPHDYYHGPWYYYLPRILIYIFPWSFFVPLIFKRDSSVDDLENKLLRFSWCWLLVMLIFFSLSSAKANYYMIVSMPALAIIMGIKITNFLATNRDKLINIWVAVSFLLIGLGFLLSYILSFGVLDGVASNYLLSVIIYLFIAAIVVAVAKKPLVAIVAMAFTIIPIMLAASSYIYRNQDQFSTAAAGQYLAAKGVGMPLYLYQDFESVSAVAFYVPSPFKIIDSKSSDLYYGKSLGSYHQYFVNHDTLAQEIAGKPAYIVVPSKKLAQFFNELPSLKNSLVKDFNRVVVVKKS